MIVIDTVTIPTPSGYIVDKEDIVKAERNANADMIKEIVASKRTISMTWAYLKASEMKILLDSLAPNFFSVTYPDPETNADRTADFYAGTKAQGGVLYQSGVMTGWKDISVTIIER